MKQSANQPDIPRGLDLNVSLTKILWKRLYETENRSGKQEARKTPLMILRASCLPRLGFWSG